MLFCQKNNRGILIVMLIIGLVTMGLGFFIWKVAAPANEGLDHLLGMLTGAGLGLAGTAAVLLIRLAVVKPEKLRAEQAEQNDERAQIVRGKAAIVGLLVGIISFMAMAFVFAGLGYLAPTYIAVGGMAVTGVGFVVAMMVYNRRI